jgi:hypothetical protein
MLISFYASLPSQGQENKGDPYFRKRQIYFKLEVMDQSFTANTH